MRIYCHFIDCKTIAVSGLTEVVFRKLRPDVVASPADGANSWAFTLASSLNDLLSSLTAAFFAHWRSILLRSESDLVYDLPTFY